MDLGEDPETRADQMSGLCLILYLILPSCQSEPCLSQTGPDPIPTPPIFYSVVSSRAALCCQLGLGPGPDPLLGNLSICHMDSRSVQITRTTEEVLIRVQRCSVTADPDKITKSESAESEELSAGNRKTKTKPGRTRSTEAH